jgi:hypothetical protein
VDDLRDGVDDLEDIDLAAGTMMPDPEKPIGLPACLMGKPGMFCCCRTYCFKATGMTGLDIQ